MKTKKIGLLTVTLVSLLVLSSFCFGTTLAQPGESMSGTNMPPDMPMDAMQYNRTDITPNMYMEQVQAMETNVFFYRNFTLMMNTTTNCELNMTLDPQVRNRIVGVSIEPNATLQLQGQLRLYINQTELNTELGREVNASRLTWMYWNQTQNQWEVVESYMNQDGYLVCNTDHFSTWTVAEVGPEQIPEGIHVFTVVGLVVAVSVASVYLKRKKN